MRIYFEKIAKDRNLDPLMAETWANITTDDIIKLKVLFYFLNMFTFCTF